MIASLFLLLLQSGTATVAPNPATLALTAASPTISFAAAGAVVPTNATLALTATSPTVSATVPTFTLSPASATLSLTASQPTISFAPAGVIAPSSSTLALTASSPTITTVAPTFAVAPASAALALTAASPTLGYTPAMVTVAPASAALRLSASQPTIAYTAASYAVSPASASLALKAASPTLDFDPFDTHAPVSLNEAKAFLRVEHDDDDALIGALIDAARDYIESAHGIVCAPRSWVFNFTGFNARLELLRGPVRGVTSVAYADTAGAAQNLASTAWRVGPRNGVVTVQPAFGTAWPCASADSIEVTADIGYASNADVPAAIRLAAQVMITNWYQVREVGEVPAGAVAMLSGYRAVAV